jgi:hypothetical protein
MVLNRQPHRPWRVFRGSLSLPRRTRLSTVTLIVLGGVCVVVGCAPQGHQTTGPVKVESSVSPRVTTRPAPSPSTSTPAPSKRPGTNRCSFGNGTVGQNALDAAVNSIEHQALVGKSVGYAGVAICIPTDEALVYWKGAVPADVERVIAKINPRIKVVVTHVPASELQLDKRIKQILADEKYWHEHGVVLSEAASDPSTGTIQIGAGGSTSAAEATRQMRKRYPGYPLVQVVRSEGTSG